MKQLRRKILCGVLFACIGSISALGTSCLFNANVTGQVVYAGENGGAGHNENNNIQQAALNEQRRADETGQNREAVLDEQRQADELTQNQQAASNVQNTANKTAGNQTTTNELTQNQKGVQKQETVPASGKSQGVNNQQMQNGEYQHLSEQEFQRLQEALAKALVGNNSQSDNTEGVNIDAVLSETNERVSKLEKTISEYRKDFENQTKAINTLNSTIKGLETKIKALEESAPDFDKIYPVGSIYISIKDTNPLDIFGGKWEKIKDTFLMASGDAYPLLSTGGANQISLESDNIPTLNITGRTEETTTRESEDGGTTNSTTTQAVTGAGSTDEAGLHTHVMDTFGSGYAINYGVEGTEYGYLGLGNAGSSNIYNAGGHTHKLNIPSLVVNPTGVKISPLVVNSAKVTGSFINLNPTKINITNKYLSVAVWKRVA